MTASEPVVSIGMPVFNGARTLRHTLDSLLAQTFPDFEIIISDNASTDATREICQEYAALDERIRYVRNTTNLGARTNYNRVFNLARGEFFRWNSHDDWIHPTYLGRCLEAFRQDPEAVACYTGMCRVPDELHPNSRTRMLPASKDAVSKSQVRRYHDSLWRMPYHPIFGMYRRSILQQTDLILNCPEPDRITLCQVALLGRFTQVEDVLFFQRRPGVVRNVWTWLDHANVDAPKRRVVRILRELRRSVDRFATGGKVQRVTMKADAAAFLCVGSIRGKIRQHLRNRRKRNPVKIPEYELHP